MDATSFAAEPASYSSAGHRYLRPANCQRFSREEERQLCRTMRKGESPEVRKAARDQLILSQIPWAIRIAQRYLQRAASRDVDDILSSAYHGVIDAVDRLKPSRGRLTTNVFQHVRKECLRFIREDTVPAVRLPSSIGSSEATKAAAARARESVCYVELYHAPPYGSAAVDYESTAFDQYKVSPRQLAAALAHLHDRDRQIVERRMAGLTLKEVGIELGLTRERIRQIEHRAHRELREFLETRVERREARDAAA